MWRYPQGSRIQASRKSKNLKIQKSKNPKIQYIYGILQFLFGFLDFWILGFWIFGFWIFGFWIFCVLHLCFQSVETAPKLDSEKNGLCVSIFTVFLRGVRVVGGVTIYIYRYINIYIYIYIYIDYLYIQIICLCLYPYRCQISLSLSLLLLQGLKGHATIPQHTNRSKSSEKFPKLMVRTVSG